MSFAASDKLTVLGNFDYGRDELDGDSIDWVGFAGSLEYQATDKFAVSPRIETLSDSSRFVTGGTDRVSGVTLTGKYKAVGGLMTRFEYRKDFSADPFFLDDSDNLKKNQTTVSVVVDLRVLVKIETRRVVNHRDTRQSQRHRDTETHRVF